MFDKSDCHFFAQQNRKTHYCAQELSSSIRDVRILPRYMHWNHSHGNRRDHSSFSFPLLSAKVCRPFPRIRQNPSSTKTRHPPTFANSVNGVHHIRVSHRRPCHIATYRRQIPDGRRCADPVPRFRRRGRFLISGR